MSSGATAQRWKDKWVLRVGYVLKPERKVGKSNVRRDARSRDSKFVSEVIPKVFNTPEEASSFAVAFWRHVENVVRGNRPRREISGKVKLRLEGNSLLHNMRKQLAFRDRHHANIRSHAAMRR